ncbi:hypothetical protein ACO0LF_05500 [Undibacterium sp. Di27W]|uniref:hypothetical protein n=1 Tax=Undibacterium sp. Di27W TaxID=3413036 RepID=UPI003BF45988
MDESELIQPAYAHYVCIFVICHKRYFSRCRRRQQGRQTQDRTARHDKDELEQALRAWHIYSGMGWACQGIDYTENCKSILSAKILIFQDFTNEAILE